MYNLITSKQGDLHGISLCHKQCFTKSLAVSLGSSYIKKTFEWFLARDYCFLFHVVDSGGQVIGYCGGFTPRFVGDGSTSGIIQYAMKEALVGVILHPWLLLHREIVAIYPLIFKNVRQRILGNKEQKTPAMPEPGFDKRVGLVVIGVHPQHRGTGVFAILMSEFERQARERGFNKLVLSVKKSNARAVNAYTRQGWFIDIEHAATLEMTKYLQ